MLRRIGINLQMLYSELSNQRKENKWFWICSFVIFLLWEIVHVTSLNTTGKRQCSWFLRDTKPSSVTGGGAMHLRHPQFLESSIASGSDMQDPSHLEKLSLLCERSSRMQINLTTLTLISDKMDIPSSWSLVFATLKNFEIKWSPIFSLVHCLLDILLKPYTPLICSWHWQLGFPKCVALNKYLIPQGPFILKTMNFI